MQYLRQMESVMQELRNDKHKTHNSFCIQSFSTNALQVSLLNSYLHTSYQQRSINNSWPYCINFHPVVELIWQQQPRSERNWTKSRADGARHSARHVTRLRLESLDDCRTHVYARDRKKSRDSYVCPNLFFPRHPEHHRCFVNRPSHRERS